MIFFLKLVLALALTVSAHAQSIEWDDLNKQVISLYQKGQYDQAMVIAKRSLDVAVGEAGSDHPNVAVSLTNLALLYKTQKQYAQAETLYKRALVIREKALGPDHPDVAQSLSNLAELYKALGQYAQAEPLLKRALGIWEKALDPNHLYVAMGLNNLAGLYWAEGRYAQAKPLLKRALAILEKTVGSEHPNVAMSLNNLAVLYDSQGQYAQAEPLFKRALAIREKALGPDHRIVATGLNNLAALYKTLGQYAQAEPLFKRALAIMEKALGSDHPDVAVSLNNLAELYKTLGQYAQAEPLLKRALAILENPLGPDHPNVAVSLNNLAGLYNLQGQYTQAEPLFKRALAIMEKALGSDHPDVAVSLNNLAELYKTLGQYAQAEPLLKRALAIMEKTLGPTHSNVATSLNNLAGLYDLQGQYAQAEPLYKRALAIREKALGPDHPDVAGSLNNLAALYKTQGQYARTEPLYKRVLAIMEKALGPDHRDVARSLNNLALLNSSQGQYAQAELLLKRALAIREKALGPDHPDVAQSLNNLASLYSDLGQYAQAEPLLKRALAIMEKTLGPDHPNVATSLNNLAVLINRSQGQYAQAEPLFKRSLAIMKRALGLTHPDVATNLANLAMNSWSSGDVVGAVALEQDANDIREQYLRLFLVRGSEYEKRAYMATIGQDTHVAISLHLAAGSSNLPAAQLALTTLLQRKGRVLDAVSDSAASLRRRLTQEDRALLDQLSAVNSQRASLYVLAHQSKIALEQYHSQVARLEEEAQALEAKISTRSVEFRVTAQPITLAKVQQALPMGTALVEFAVYHPINLKAQKVDDRWGPARYIAYVLRPQGDPLSVDLGKAIDIDRRISELRGALADSSRDSVPDLARGLDEQVMRPIRKLLGETQTVFLSPDGELNLVPFGALVDENNQYLINRYAFTYLSSGRDLLRLQAKAQSQHPGIIIADVDFGVAISPIQTTQAGPGTANRRSGAFLSGTFQALPGTVVEARAISKILPALKVLTGKQATEGALKQVNGPRILHVATHGFFLPNLRDEIREERRLQPFDDVRMPTTENPLLRSGLALANANQLQSGTEDGVLTALEAAGLNLWGTRLTVLSACETGLGNVQNGEGVFGLRRALVIAGSESQVVSLWKVDDLATKDLMVDYYRRLVSGKGRSEALRQAQLAMLASIDRRHPFYWASFIPSGDWTQLD